MPYRYYNANPLKNNVADCTTRAISLAENNSWDYTYNKLSKLAQRRGKMLDSVDFIEEYLDSKYRRQCHYSKTLDEFIKEHPKGTYLVTMPNHITCVIDGYVYDTFNCLKNIIRCAWQVKK